MCDVIEILRCEIAEREAAIDTLTREINAMQVTIGVLCGVPTKPVVESASPQEKLAKPQRAPKPSTVEKGQSVFQAQCKLMLSFLKASGAETEWVKATYGDLAEAIDVSPPTIRSLILELEQAHGLKVHRVTSGPEKGNHFTFADLEWGEEVWRAEDGEPEAEPQPEPESPAAPEPEQEAKPEQKPAPEKKPEKPAPEKETAKKEAWPVVDGRDLASELLGYLKGIAERTGVPSFQLPHDRILKSNHCTYTEMVAALDELQSEGVLTCKLSDSGTSYHFHIREVI